MSSKNSTSPRWWPLIVIWALAIASWIFISLTNDANRQLLVMKSSVTGTVACVLSLIWLLALSRLSWKRRFQGLGIAALCGLILAGLFRVDGVYGDLVPIVKFRWAGAGKKIVGETVDGGFSIAQSYPQFLGPNRDAKVNGVTLDPDWEGNPPELIWRQPIGEAWSAFATSGNRAVTQEQDGPDEVVVCYKLLTGQKLWEHRYPARYDNPLGGIGPRATPTIEEDRVYVLGALGDFVLLDLQTGNKTWSWNIQEKHGANLPDWGFAGSPLIVDDLVIISVGARNGHSLVAYDKFSGDFVWSGGSDKAHWSSPVYYEVAGSKQVVIFNWGALFGHSIEDGSVLWEYEWDTDGMPHVSIPVPVSENQLLVSSGYGKGAELLEFSEEVEGKQSVERMWRTLHLKAKFNNYIFKDGYAYGLDDGVFTCIDVAKGRRTWKQGRYGHGQNILVGDLMLLTTERGEVLLTEPIPKEPRILGRFHAFTGKSWNPPALIGEFLLLRTHEEAALYRLPILEG